MVRTCAIVTCDYKETKKVKIQSLFKVPKNKLSQWNAAVKPSVPILNFNSFICENHFKDTDMLQGVEFNKEGNGVLIYIPVGRKRLKSDVVPSIFSIQEKNKKIGDNSEQIDECEGSTNNNEVLDQINSETSNIHECEMTMSEPTSENVNSSAENIDPTESAHIMTSDVECLNNVTNETLFTNIITGKTKLCLPNKSWTMCVGDSAEDPIVFLQAKYPIQDFLRFSKQVLLYKTGQIELFVFNKRQEDIFQTPQSVSDLKKLLVEIDEITTCEGGPSIKEYKNVQPRFAYEDMNQRWRHNRCPVKLMQGKVCKYCVSISKVLNLHIERKRQNNKKIRISSSSSTNKTIQILRDAKRKQSQAIQRNRARINRALTEVKQLQAEVVKISNEKFESSLKQLNLPENQILLVKECAAAAKRKSPKGNRYTGEWLLLCLLLNIRSPAAYNFLRSNNVLPLPSYGTIRRYLNLIDLKCGFDRQFFNVLKKKFGSMSPREKHGVLLFDEMQVRKSLNVSSKTLTFTGLIDIGTENTKTPNIDDLADHALVFMFSSIGGQYHQPIASFASKNATEGIVLARLIVQAILEIENAGGFVNGIICDGASTNRKMWSELGISGTLHNTNNYFQNPARENAKVYVFSDSPHLMKTIRNRLLNEEKLKMKNEFIEWKFYSYLYEEELKNSCNLRVCPKITRNHIAPTNQMRMRVFLATQIFSNSVADGLEFYKKRNPQKFSDCEATIDFTRKINNLFDALNRSFAAQGIRKNSADLQTLQTSLNWLNEWEQEKLSCQINSKEFLTDQTAQGLRVTITSTLELCSYLLECGDFEYVLTGKLNQDKLEQFFGVIRQAGCQNDHPTLPTFLQLYRMLSVYQILKPPKHGNCLIQSESVQTPRITMEELKNIFDKKSNDLSRLDKLKLKLDNIISTSDWEVDDVFDCDYSMSTTVDCIIYYITGFVSRKLKKKSNCHICVQIFQGTTFNFGSEAELVNIKTRGGLIHPNHHLYSLFQAAENLFQRHISFKDSNIYEAVSEDLLSTYTFTYPCDAHKLEVLSYCIDYYIGMRMRQFARIANTDLHKKSQAKKKMTKLYAT